ncbi:MAG: integrase arm-type DNA-binding domain-containing protein [Betaproteobacteria bacterium]
MPLTNTEILRAKPGAKPIRLFDGGGSYLEIRPTGAKLWRFKYRIDGKEKLLALGAYPEVSLVKARQKRDEARALLASGTDPSEQRKTAKERRAGLAENTFEVIGREWYSKNVPTLAVTTKEKLIKRLEGDVFPWIGAKPIASITAADLIKVIERIEQRGALEIARRVHNSMGRIFRYAVGRGIVSRDPSRDIELRDILPPENVKHHASLTEPKAVGGLLRAIEGFTGAFVTQCALRLAPLVFVRPGELRHAEWAEFDFDKAEWRIPAGKMKMKEQHIVPLSVQAVAVLKEIQPLTGTGRYVFPSVRGGARPMSENTVGAALRRLGFTKDEMTGHGFRSMASTLLHELGLPHAVIERQLAHGERNKVSAAYNFAEHLPERRKMMQQWADYLESLKAGADVIALRGRAA